MSECYNSVMEQKVFGNIMFVLCLHTKQLAITDRRYIYLYKRLQCYIHYSIFIKQNKNARLRCRAFCLRSYDFDYLSLLKSIRSFSSFEPLAFSNISRRCSTVRFFFSSPEISRIILPSLIIIRRLP